MKGITISDEKDNVLSFDLVDILNFIGEKAICSKWKVSYVECNGRTAEELHKISDEKILISGKHLFLIASNLLQTIDGKFEAFLGNELIPWLIIRAVDSSEFDVETDDFDVLQKIRQSFSNVVDLVES